MDLSYLGKHRQPDLQTQDCNGCTCARPWNAVIPPPPCPTHGKAPVFTVTCSTDTTIRL